MWGALDPVDDWINMNGAGGWKHTQSIWRDKCAVVAILTTDPQLKQPLFGKGLVYHQPHCRDFFNFITISDKMLLYRDFVMMSKSKVITSFWTTRYTVVHKVETKRHNRVPTNHTWALT